MSPSSYWVEALSPIDVDYVAGRLPWEVQPIEDSETLYAPTDHDAPWSVYLSCSGIDGLRDYGLPTNFRFAATPLRHQDPDVQRLVWQEIVSPVLNELLASGPSYGRIFDAHCEPPIVWTPESLYVDIDARYVPMYRDLIEKWPGIEEIRILDQNHKLPSIPWLSGRHSGNPACHEQTRRLMDAFCGWTGDIKASDLVYRVEQGSQKVERAEAFVPAFVRLFPAVGERVRWANRAFFEWEAADIEAFDKVMKKFVSL